MAQFVKKNTFLILSLIGQISYIDTGITTRLADKNECTNTDITFDWTYDFQTDLESASWKRGTTPIIIKPAGGVPEVQPGYESKIQYISGGQMKILNAELTDSATYTLDVAYTLGSGHSSDSDSVIVNIQDPPAVPTGNCTDSQCKCYVTYLGSPAGILKIKVNDDASQTPAEITSLRDAKKVYCCVEGNSVKCLPQNTDRGSEYCVDIYEAPPTTTPRPCRLYVCYIGVYVAVLSAVVILVVYFIVRCLFEILCGADFLLKIVLPSCCCMVICIICVVAICIPVEPDCDAGVGIGVPIVIVIILHPCVTVGVIVCHFKWCPSLGESSESCLGRNRSILPICSGQDPQNPQNPGQPPQRQAEPQIRHGPGGTQSNQGRPQPQSGDEKHHSSVQKSNPEKSGSAVSGSHVAFDEEPFKPRKLPGIPADSKNARGLSANFDEVLPDKHRLTPLGQEARFDEFEETPKKKKKKKKSSEKDLDTSTDL